MSEQMQTAKSLCQACKREPNGKCFSNLGADGVYRVYHSESFEVIDGVGLSPAQIKQSLDRFAFDQATEDKFRGVDGRSVSTENVFNPPEGIRPKRPTEEEKQEMERMIAENNRKAKKDLNAVCGMQRSNYNLDPI